MAKLFTQDEVDVEIRKAIKAASLELPYAWGRIAEELKNSPKYYLAGVHSIKHSFFDAYFTNFRGTNERPTTADILNIGEIAAKRLIDILITPPIPQPKKVKK